jgi:hypothetical protein
MNPDAIPDNFSTVLATSMAFLPNRVHPRDDQHVIPLQLVHQLQEARTLLDGGTARHWPGPGGGLSRAVADNLPGG